MTAAAGSGRPAYRRIVLKLSGEALAGDQGYGIDPPVLDRVGAEIREVIDLGVQVAIVIGGGNIFRGIAASAAGMDRAIAEPYIRRRAIRHLEKGRVVIFAAGTGNPFFTTDTAGALRAVEIGADVFLKASKVDGIYTADPAKDPTAVKLPRVGYIEALNRGLAVMDTTAISLCMDNKLPIVVFDLTRRGNIRRIVAGEPVGSVVSGDATSPKG